MRYRYFYQTRENEEREGTIDARDRGDAYARLRKAGIKPYRLVGRNPRAWKRWAAIVVLSIAVAALWARLVRVDSKARSAEEGFVRHQIYGDPAIIESGTANGWAACGFGLGESHLAKYAQPGLPVVSHRRNQGIAAAVDESLGRRIEPSDGELLEYRQMKRIVEAMKDELRRYKAAGGTTEKYLERLDERQKTEAAYVRSAAQELDEARNRLSDDELAELWTAKNAELRAIGLPMLRDPAEE